MKDGPSERHHHVPRGHIFQQLTTGSAIPDKLGQGRSAGITLLGGGPKADVTQCLEDSSAHQILGYRLRVGRSSLPELENDLTERPARFNQALGELHDLVVTSLKRRRKQRCFRRKVKVEGALGHSSYCTYVIDGDLIEAAFDEQRPAMDHQAIPSSP